MEALTISDTVFDIAKLSLAVSILATIAVGVYRLALSPLRNVPGPKLAALTTWYEFYFDCYKQGKYIFKIDEMHEKYGPIVRINPHEVHIKDPEFFDVLYGHTSKLDKDPWFYKVFDPRGGTFGTFSHELHRKRRGAMQRFFSPASIGKLEPQIHVYLQKMLDLVEGYRAAGAVVDLSSAFRAVTSDVVTAYMLPTHRGFLDQPAFAKPMHDASKMGVALGVWNRHFPFLTPMLKALPRSVTVWMDPSGGTTALKDFFLRTEVETRAVMKASDTSSSNSAGDKMSMFEAIYTNPSLPESEKTFPRMFDEIIVTAAAGSETTSNVMTALVYHVLANPPMHKRLMAELSTAAGTLPNDPTPTTILPYRALEKQPFITALVKEALRHSQGVTGRLPRLNPAAPTTYTTPGPDGKTYTFPPATVLSMTIRDILTDASIFADPHAFKPSRWLASDSDSDSDDAALRRMERHFAPFGRGPRMCVGMELARQELLLVVGNLFWRFGARMRLWETEERDVALAHDFFAPFAAWDSRGLRVKIG